MKCKALVVLCVLALMVAWTSAVFAQVVTTPDEGVRGTGSIVTSTNLVAMFDVNVARSGNVLFGGFKYSEASTATTRGNTIYSQQITGLTIPDNHHATITAVGYWNGMLADLTVEATDNPDVDTFHIIAKPKNSMLLIIYDQSGPVKGDIVVYSKTIAPDGYVKGDGTIAVKTNTGRFQVSAQKIGGVAKGNVYYYEYNPMVMSIYERPIVRIYLPAVQTLDFSGTTATLKGKGYLNGMPALIEVTVKDYSTMVGPIAAKDEFWIKATPVAANSISNMAGYAAGGPLTSGDVVVKINPKIQ